MSFRKIKPMDPHRSGWCLKLPANEWSQAEHDKCPQTFPQLDCECPCGHKGARTLESRAMVRQPYVPPKTKAIKVEEEDKDEDD